MQKISLFNKLFIALFILLMIFVILKVPHENNVNTPKYQLDEPSR